jgi:hypothetical protein
MRCRILAIMRLAIPNLAQSAAPHLFAKRANEKDMSADERI